MLKYYTALNSVMPLPSYDRLDHSGVLFNHLDRMGKEVSELFKKEFKDGNISGALPSSKVENWKAMVLWLETLLIPYLKGQYEKRADAIKETFDKAWKKKDLQGCFIAMNELSQILVLEASSQGFMMKQSVSGDYVIDLDDREEDGIEEKA